MVAVVIALGVIVVLATLACALDDRRDRREAERKAAEARAARMQAVGASWAKRLGVGK